MPARIYRIFISLCLVLFIASGIYAENIDDTPEVISLYTKGKRFLRESEWLAAAGVFKELEGRFSQSKNIDLFIFHRAKAELYLGDYYEAIAGFNYFISRFQHSAAISHAYFFLGNSLYLNGNVNQAVKSYLKAYLLSGEKELNQLIASSLVETFKNASSIHLNEGDFGLLPDDKKCTLIKPLVKILIKKGAIERANRLLSICGEKINSQNNQATNYRRLKKQLEIALVIPLEGELHSFGEEIYNGATIAADFYREKTGHDIKLIPYDTKGEPIEAARIIRELSRSTTTDVIVGPLTSEEAAVSSAILSCTSIPMITPAATQAGLTRLSETSFQLSPNIELEGITLADYAFNQLLADTAAIISSTANEHLRMTGAFSEHFKKLGGVIVATEYYRSRDKDFGTYIKDIKSILLGHPADSTFFITEEGDTIDFDIAPSFVDCLFIPGNSKQLRQLLPQIHFYNLNGFYLGSDGWGDAMIYKLGDKVTRNAVFASPFIEGKSSQEYQKLAIAYDSRYGNPPHRLATLGYDAVSLITQVVLLEGVSRDNIFRGLQEITDYAGASGKISFGSSRENMDMPLFRIELEQPVPITGKETEFDNILFIE